MCSNNCGSSLSSINNFYLNEEVESEWVEDDEGNKFFRPLWKTEKFEDYWDIISLIGEMSNVNK